MQPLHYVEIENFKCFGDRQRIDLDHPAMLIGPNNCGKTTAMQALALWSHAVRSWHARRATSRATRRTAVAVNRLAVVSVPVQTARHFWHDMVVRERNTPVTVAITVGVLWQGEVRPVCIRLRSQGDELLYCAVAEEAARNDGVVRHAAAIDVALLYPMSGIETEEPLLQPGRVDVLLGQGQSSQVLRNLCLTVYHRDPADWQAIVERMGRLFGVSLGTPTETARGAVELVYKQAGAHADLDLSLAGRGCLQMLLLLAYLYAHKGSVLLIDEPDAHMEILRQRQVYVLLSNVAVELGAQVVMATHSEVLLEQGLPRNVSLLLAGRAERVQQAGTVQSALRLYGAAHYLKARVCGYVLYVEGSTDVEMLAALAARIGHRAARLLEGAVNVCYVQCSTPDVTADSEQDRVEGGPEKRPRDHFMALRRLIPELRGLAVLDGDNTERRDADGGGLRTCHWPRYEAENYFVSPEVLLMFVEREAPDTLVTARSLLADLISDRVFGGNAEDFGSYASAPPAAARLIWEGKTNHLKLSAFAEEFFRRLGEATRAPMLLRKGNLHRLVEFVEPRRVPPEVRERLDLIASLIEPLPE
ncbi:MAG: AAA family ATPase [Armatimonadetes bacterium]|nr:AAA family ATPase [Armatimonadota bacterium]